MPRDALSSVVQHLHRIVDDAASDAELLGRFVGQRDESAFALLVWRHGPLVLGLCQRLLRHEQDSEDAFQATFLTLARKADSIGKKEALASWLYKVAYRIACRLRAKTPMVTNQSASLEDKPAPQVEADVIWRDLRGVLDQEIAALPEAHGRAIILCYLEGKTQDEAASLLGCPKGTLTVRLTRARERLRQRLTRRGLALSAGGLATVMAEKALAGPVSAELVHATARSALAFASGKTVAAGVLSAKAVILAEGVLQMMWYSKVKMMAIVLLTLLLTGSGVGWWAAHLSIAGPASDHGQVQREPIVKPSGDPKADLATLRAEVAKLRLELDAALKEIKALKDAKQDSAPKQQEALYRGKPLSFYLEQLKDRDPGFRGEAITVIGVFAKKDKKLISLLVEAIKDDGRYLDKRYKIVGETASDALHAFGPEVFPAVLDILKDNSQPDAQARAASFFIYFGPEARSAVPALTKALKDSLVIPVENTGKPWTMRKATIQTLGYIGPDAKSAIPIIAGAFEPAMLALELHAKQQNTSIFGYLDNHSLPAVIIVALTRIDPEIKALLPSVLELGLRDESPSGSVSIASNRNRPAIEAAWQKAREVLQKRYGKAK